MTANPNTEWKKLCSKNDLIPNSGVAALHEGNLPYSETRNYLQKVTKKLDGYRNLINKTA